MKKENVFIINLKELYKEGMSLTLIKRCARNDVRFGDISEEEHEEFTKWLEEQEQIKKEAKEIEDAKS